MIGRALAALVLAGAATLAGAQDVGRARFADIDRAFDDTMARYALPGLVLGVVENGEIVYARAAGELVAGEGARIDSATLFKIASNTKAMTAATIARLVDRGALAWNDPVTEHLPEFAMHDAWVTREMQVRDLLIHNSGLRAGAGDLMLWPEPNHYTRADIVAGVKHLVPIASFRSRYDYDNLLYIVAGEVAARAGGASYEKLVAREVFEPLGLDRCRVGAFDRDAVGNVAQPHARRGDGPVAIRRDDAHVPAITSAAAGGVRCSLDDMLAWLRVWLDDGSTWLSAPQRAAMWAPQNLMPVSARMRAWDRTNFSAYAYGWRLADVDGELKVSHTGTLAGMYSMTTMLPARDHGFVLMTNGEGEAARTVLGEVLVKRWTAPQERRTVAYYADLLDAEAASEPASAKAPDVSKRTRASAKSLATQLGRYRDPWFGEATICADGDRVRFRALKSPMLDGTVMRVGDGFLVDWADDTVDAEAWLRFTGSTLAMAKVDPQADFSFDFEDLAFERVGGCDDPALVDVATLVPDLVLDLRYATANNFVGERIDGYDAPRCLLLKPAAEALARAERRARAAGHRLAIYDCYRPRRAVAHFMRWADALGAARKAELVPDYISPTSGHSRAATVDLTLLACDQPRCDPLDMGAPFDTFAPVANTDTPAITDAQRANRAKLRTLMHAEGYANYPLEWWHYTLAPEPSQESYDVPVK